MKEEKRKKTQAEVDLVNHIQAIVGMAAHDDVANVKDIRSNRGKEKRKMRKDFVREVVMNE